MSANVEDLEGEAERLARREIERTSPGEATLERLAARFGVPQGWYEEDDWGVAQTQADAMGFGEMTMIGGRGRGLATWICAGAGAIRADGIVALWATPEGKVVILLETGDRIVSVPRSGMTAAEMVASCIEALTGGDDEGSGDDDGGGE